MSVTVTRTIQIICLLLVFGSVLAMFGSRGDLSLIAGWATVLGASLAIFLLAAILRVISDVAEKVLQSMGYRKP